MAQADLIRRLSPMDAFFLFIEREEQPMNVACVAAFEGHIPFRRFVSHIESRLHLIPRYRQRVIPSPLNAGLPTWEFDPEFDIKNHIFPVKLKRPGSDEQFRRLVDTLFEGTLDRDKPLWEIHLVHGLNGKRTGMFAKVHHCMVDGIAGVELLTIIFDAWPNTKPVRKKPYRPRPIPSPSSLLHDALWDSAIDSLEHWSKFQHGLAEYMRGQEPAGAMSSLAEFALTMKDFLTPNRRLPFNKPFSGKRKTAYGTFSFTEARAIRAACGGTVNDVMLAILTGAVRRYLIKHDESLRKRYLRVLVPVNLRREKDRGTLGNRISFLPVEVPLDIQDPVERLRQVRLTTQHLKENRVIEAVSLMFDVLQGTPALVQSLSLSGAASRAGQSLLGLLWQVPPMHLICTNVPGPQIPLYGLGHKLEYYYALLPVALEMGISCGISSYDQRLYVSMIADQQAAPDGDELMDAFVESFRELREAAAVKERHFLEIPREARDKAHTRAGSNGKSVSGLVQKERTGRPSRSSGKAPVPKQS